MKVLEKNKDIFIRLGFVWTENPNDGRKRRNILGIVFIVNMTSTFLSNVAYIIFAREDLQSALHALFGASALFSLLIPLIVILIVSRDFSPLFDGFQTFCDRNPSIFFENAEKLSQKFTQILVFYFIPYFCVSNICAFLFPPLISYAKDGFIDADNLVLQYKFL